MKKQSNKKKPEDHFTYTTTKTIKSVSGEILLYSADDFYNRIVKGNDCFICGARRKSKKFNDEHVLPDWILKKYKLYDKAITLSNEANFKYGKYKV